MQQPHQAAAAHVPVHVADPPRYLFFGTEIAILLTTEQTGGQFSMVEGTFPPAADAGLHFHRLEDESLYAKSGVLSVQVGEAHFELAAGQSCFIPRGTPHRLRNLSGEPVRVLAIHTPGNFDRFVADVATPVGQPIPPLTPDALQTIADICDRYGTVMLDPPPLPEATEEQG